MKSDSYYRDLLADVVGDVWPAPHSTAVKAAHAALVGEHPQVEAELSAEAARVVTQVRAPTDVGKFATGLRGMSEASWRSALEKLRAAGHRTERMLGTVADDPTVTGGYVLREPRKRAAAQARTWEELCETDRRWIYEHRFEDGVIEGRATVRDDEMGLEL